MLDFPQSLITSALRRVLKHLDNLLSVMLSCVRWYEAYLLSLRPIEEMMQKPRVFVDHIIVQRWAIKSIKDDA